MSTTTTTPTRPDRPPRNGVDTPAFFATLDAVRGAPQAALFKFRARNEWISGTHSRSTIADFYGAGEEHLHKAVYAYDSDHPAVLVGQDNGPTPVEHLLHALAGCLTAGIANIAAARGVTLTEVRSTVEGTIDLRGILGLDQSVRNGFQRIDVRLHVAGDAPAEVLEAIAEQSRQRSAVFDVLTNGTSVEVSVDA